MRPRFPATPLPRLQRCDECGRWELPRPGHTHRRGYGLCVGGIAELTAANRNSPSTARCGGHLSSPLAAKCTKRDVARRDPAVARPRGRSSTDFATDDVQRGGLSPNASTVRPDNSPVSGRQWGDRTGH